METDRSYFCGCKGIRTCLLCEQEFGLQAKDFDEQLQTFSYCWKCGKCHAGRNETGKLDEIACTHDGIAVPGIYIEPDFISTDEESVLIKQLDEIPWSSSQSGRRKQNYGPKCNFKKRKLKIGDFKGFPECGRFVQERFEKVEILKCYRTIEQCSLEYDPDKGASIEPHIDDCWIWGERIVTVNLISDCVLSLRPYHGARSKYNLDCSPPYIPSNLPDILLRIPMPRRSLLVLYGEVRYNWEHMVFRNDVSQRRVCLAYREFTQPYLPGGESYYKSVDILNMAHNFFPNVRD